MLTKLIVTSRKVPASARDAQRQSADAALPDVLTTSSPSLLT